MKINMKKLKEEIAYVTRERKGGCQNAPPMPTGLSLFAIKGEPPEAFAVRRKIYWDAMNEGCKARDDYRNRTSAVRATLLYSLAAHCHNRIHVKTEYIWDPKAGKLIKYSYSFEDQIARLEKAGLFTEFAAAD